MFARLRRLKRFRLPEMLPKKLSLLLCIAGIGLLILGIAAAIWWPATHTVAVLQPRGTIAAQQRTLMVTALLLAVIVVVPVFVMLGVFAWRYRAGNHGAAYTPEASSSRLLESIWWLIPLGLIVILSVITWRTSHTLDPFRPLAAAGRPLRIQVIALQWKWLFIYPDEHIATLNEVRFPKNVPVNFTITSDAPMNSFWIPQLGGQVYAMSGMSTQLHLMASQAGNYRGVSANISGKGFAGMHFTATALSAADYDEWVRFVKAGNRPLTPATYQALARPSENMPPSSYATAPDNLYDEIVMKYMDHGMSHTGMEGM